MIRCQRFSDLEGLCNCLDAGEQCCYGVGLSSTHPFTLNPDWSLRYGKPLITPHRAPSEWLVA